MTSIPELKLVEQRSLKPQPKEWTCLFAVQGASGPELLSGKGVAVSAATLKEEGFKGAELDMHWARPSIIVGLGKRTDLTPDTLRRAASKVIRSAEHLKLSKISVIVPDLGKIENGLQALAEGLLLGSYRFNRYQTQNEDSPVPPKEIFLVLEKADHQAQESLRRAKIYSNATMLARDLINEPPSVMHPERLAAEALKLKSSSISVHVFEKKDLEKMGMGGILGVGAGGAIPPQFVELIYKPSGAKKSIALVGKGITFDSGGLSLKPAQGMETMKDDMSGAAAVLGVFSALSELKPKVEVRGYIAIAENMPGGKAQKPGDVLKTYKGKTIEVLNTDAEGRLVLADALSYASSKKPDIMIDIATLTGAAVVALGHLVSAVMTMTPSLARDLIRAGETAGEKIWELPLVKEYQKDIKSKIADVKNIGGRRGEAGTIIGGLFLQEFVDGATWAHLDIAGPSWTDSDQPYCPTGGTGHPVRTLLNYLEAQSHG